MNTQRSVPSSSAPVPFSATPMPLRGAEGQSPMVERLSHLFRASLKDGRIHPLYLQILKYRNARQDARGS